MVGRESYTDPRDRKLNDPREMDRRPGRKPRARSVTDLICDAIIYASASEMSVLGEAEEIIFTLRRAGYEITRRRAK